MRALLDTHALLWWITQDSSLSQLARTTISETGNEIVVSVASAWELALKVRYGRLPQMAEFVFDFTGNVKRERFTILDITADHAVRAGLLSGDHKDPFDRMLIAQSQAENIPLISNEKMFDGYGIRRLW